MTAEPPDSDALRGRVRQALADADLGDGGSFLDLAVGRTLDVQVLDERVIVTVRLPVPSADRRSILERNLRRAVGPIEGVSDVTCRFSPVAPDPGTDVELLPDVKHVVAVGSGKGGVGKSTVAVNLATALASTGASIGLVDADIYGPNAPTMFGLSERTPDATLEDRILPREAHGVKVMSIDFLLKEDDPVIWRGPLVDRLIKQLFGDVQWGTLEYLIVDLPPGTGDAQLTLVQHVPVTGAVVVTTPQPVATDDARRGIRGFVRYDVPVLGIVENMAAFECPDCGTEHEVFGSGGADRLSREFGVPVLGRIPLDPAVGTHDETDDSTPPGVSIPGIGRLQLPRTRSERDPRTRVTPIAARDGDDTTHGAIERLATRAAARIANVTHDGRRPDDTATNPN